MPSEATETLMTSFMNYLYTVLTDGLEQFDPRNAQERFITWCLPGIPYQPDELRFLHRGLVGEGDTPEARAADRELLIGQAARFAMLVDFVPDVTGIHGTEQHEVAYHRNESTLSRVYQRALAESQVAYQELTADEQAQIARWQAALYATTERVDQDTGEKIVEVNASPMMRAYKKYQSTFAAAFQAYNSARLGGDPGFVFNEPILRQQVMLALDEWNVAGKKGEVETMLARISQMTNRDLSLWKRDLEGLLLTARKADPALGEFLTTSLVPSGFARADSGWSSHKFDHVLSTKHRQGRHTLFKADVTIPILKLTLGGGGSTRRDVVREYATLTDLSISFEVAQIPLVRPWFDPTFLESRAWRFGDQALEMTQLSDGGSPPTGQLIGYPTSVIFVRKVCVTSKEVRDSFTEIKQHAKAGGGITLGLFSLTPRSQVTTDSSTTTHEQTDAALVSEGVQVIGFRCHLLDKSPNPLPTIKAFV